MREGTLKVFTPEEGLWDEGGTAVMCSKHGVFVVSVLEDSLCKSMSVQKVL